MSTLKVTLTPTAANDYGAKWCIEGVTGWLDSGDTATFTYDANQTIAYRYVEGFLKPSTEAITTGAISRAYTATQWLSTWGPPICGCMFKGQVLLGGRYYTTEQTFPSDSRIIRWSEIGAFRFSGATANDKKNEAGYMYLGESSSETVMSLIPLKNAVVVYSDMSVTLLNPVSQPAPTYGVDTLLSGIGIANPLAAAGHRNQHLYVDKEGNLREVSMGQYGQGYVSTNLGYKHIFAPMQEDFDITTGIGLIVVTYNPDEDEFYISDGRRSFVWNKSGLTEIGVAITSYINTKNTIISAELFDDFQSKRLGGATQLDNSEYMYLETDIFDFGLSAIKTIQQVEIGGGFGTNATVKVMIKWRMNRNELFRDTDWKRCSPNGVCTPLVSGTDFKICIMVSVVPDTVINNITVEWKVIDRTSIRGNNAGSSAS